METNTDNNSNETKMRTGTRFWRQVGACFIPQPTSDITLEQLTSDVYFMKYTKEIGIYLEKIFNKFSFNYKVYGIETKFIEHVIRTFNTNEYNNLGILLNGEKGTGKTVTAEQICNKLNLPVIVVQNNFPGLVPFLVGLSQDVIIFFDEFEKVFGRNTDDNEEDNSGSTQLLSVLDGACSTNEKNRKLFLFTTNNTRIDLNLIQRPGRIRYVKSFGNLDKGFIAEIIEDKLTYKDFKKDLFDVISKLEIITVDIISSIINEINIHNMSPYKFIDFFNVKIIEVDYTITSITPDTRNNSKRKNNVITRTIARKVYIRPIGIFDKKEHKKIIDDKELLYYSSYPDDFSSNLGKIISIELMDDYICKVRVVDEYDEDRETLLHVYKNEKSNYLDAFKHEFLV